MKLEIANAGGAVIRTYTSKARGGDDRRDVIPGSPGMHRAVWDLRTAALDAPRGLTFFGTTAGPMVGPGQYTLTLSVAGRSYTAPLTVREDPRVTLTPTQIAEQVQTTRTISDRVNEIFHDAKRLTDVRDQVRMIVAHAGDLPDSARVASTGKQLAARLDSLSVDLVQPQHTNGQDIIIFPNGVVDEWVYLLGSASSSYMPVTGGVKQRLADLQQQWSVVQSRIDDVLGNQVSAFNAMLGGKAAVIVPKVRAGGASAGSP